MNYFHAQIIKPFYGAVLFRLIEFFQNLIWPTEVHIVLLEMLFMHDYVMDLDNILSIKHQRLNNIGPDLSIWTTNCYYICYRDPCIHKNAMWRIWMSSDNCLYISKAIIRANVSNTYWLNSCSSLTCTTHFITVCSYFEQNFMNTSLKSSSRYSDECFS